MILKPTTIYVSLNGDVLNQSRTSIYRYSDINEIRLVSPLAVEGGMRVNFLLSNGVTIEQKVMTALTEKETVGGEEWNVWSYRPTNVITATLTAQSVTTLQLSFTQIVVVSGKQFGNTFGTATLSINPTIEGPEPTLEDTTTLNTIQGDVSEIKTDKIDKDLSQSIYPVLTVIDEDESFVYVYYNGGSYKVSLQQWIELVNTQFTTFSTRLAFLEGAVPQPVGVGTQPSFNKVTVNELTFLKNGDTATIDYEDALAINTIESHINDEDIHFLKSDVSQDDVGLDKVDNTTDLAKPISNLTQEALDTKQATLVSGTNIKTLNNTSLLGEGDLDISTLLPNALEFKGTFGSAQSTTGGDLPTIGNSVGDIYIADTNNFESAVAGVTFQSGDKALFDGTTFLRNAANDSVTSVNTRVGAITLTAADVGLDNVANTAQVTSVTGTSPIVATAGTTPQISILAATDAVAGSMSAADKLKLDSLTAKTVLFDEVTFTGQLFTEPATTNTQDALVLLDTHTHGVADLTDLSATTVTYDNTGQNLVATTVQAAINEIDDLVEEGLTQIVIQTFNITNVGTNPNVFSYTVNGTTVTDKAYTNNVFEFDLVDDVVYNTGANRLVVKVNKDLTLYAQDTALTELTDSSFSLDLATKLKTNDVVFAKLFQSLATVSIDIAAASVTSDKLADGAVTTVKLANNNVTLAKVEQIPTNTMLGNDTGDTANVKALTVAETKTLLALDQVQNTLDVNKPISNDTATALNAKVTGPASAVNNRVATFDGTTGKLIKDSGFTIETSVPAGALFTDTGDVNLIEIVQAEGTPLSITSKTVNVTRASLDAAQVDFYDTTIAAADTWALETGSYVLTKTGGNLTGLLSTDQPIIDINLAAIAVATVPAIQSAWALVYRVQITADTIKLFATDDPDFTVDTPLALKVVR